MDWLRPILTISLLAGLTTAPVLHAEDVHDGDDSYAPGFDMPDDGMPVRGGSAASAVVLGGSGASPVQLRDGGGKLLPPPNFRTASEAFQRSIELARNPPPPPAPVAAAKAPAPEQELEIENIPTYNRGAPNPKVGFVGVDLSPDPPRLGNNESAVAPAREEAASAEKKVNELAGTASQIREAIGGKVSNAADSQALADSEKKREAREAERISRIGRLPASFTKPKLGTVQ